MSRKSRNVVLLVLCVFLAFSAIACMDGDVLQDRMDANAALEGVVDGTALDQSQ